MQPERWQKVKALLESALELAPGERDALLDESCAEDAELRREVESYLKAYEQASEFIEQPAARHLAPLLESQQTATPLPDAINSYKIINSLGEGGMGVVFLAIDMRLGRRVALKMLHSRYSADPERTRRFQQEARAASALSHPNILTIYEVGKTATGDHFIASEFVEGETLREKLQNQTFSLAETLEIAAQIAAALSAAHAAGIVHRDIKPENIMIREDGLVKVLDFGLVKLIEKKDESFDALTRPQVQTSPGVVMGTFAYMSPEQARGKDVDERTDIWSLGVVMYEILAGEPPFSGETTSDLIVEILTKEPLPLANYIPAIPKELERTIGKILRKDRKERYQHIKDLLIDLRDLRRELEAKGKLEGFEGFQKAQKITPEIEIEKINEAPKTPVAEKARMPLRWVGAAALVLLLIALGGAAFFNLTSSPKEISRKDDSANIPISTDSTGNSVKSNVNETLTSSNNAPQPTGTGNTISNSNVDTTSITEPTKIPSPSVEASVVSTPEMPTYGMPNVSPTSFDLGLGTGLGRTGDGMGSGNGYGSGSGLQTTPEPMPAPTAGGATTPLKILSRPRVQYTDAARQKGIQGEVLLRVTFLANGTIGGISVIRGLGYGLTEQAIAAARQIRFEPKKVNGVPQSVTQATAFTFTIY